ncbi:MAG: hypothetical protein LWW81_11445, partial [Rhodocyclales bacterium]|nr:hypothetical protein [Rhodocyclales bacterium]
EIDMVSGDDKPETWCKHQRKRLMIEKDEPPVYKVLDILCRNDLLQAEGYKRDENPEHFCKTSLLQRLTSQILR